MKRLWLIMILTLTLISVPLFLIYSFKWEKEIELKLSSGPEGGVYYSLAKGIANIVEKEHPKIKIKVGTSTGSKENITKLMNHSAELTMVQNDTKGNPNDPSIRTVAPLYMEVLHFLAYRRDPGIEKVLDISGKTVFIGAKESGTRQLVVPLLEHYGLNNNDFESADKLSLDEARKQLMAGKIDAMFQVRGMKSDDIQKIVKEGKVKLVGFGKPIPEGGETEAFCLENPFVKPYVIPINSYNTENKDHPREPQQPVPTWAVPALLISHKDVQKEVIRRITQTIFENKIALVESHVSAAQITDDFDPFILQFPIHPGAQSYYDRDKPNFLVNHAESMGFILSGIIALVGLGAAARQWRIRHYKNRIDLYYLRLDELLHRISDQHVNENSLRNIKSELADIRNSALHELVNERLFANESFTIFQSMLSDCLREVESKLTQILSGNYRAPYRGETEQ